MSLELATPADTTKIVALRIAVAEHLTWRYGVGHWSGQSTERGVLYGMRTASLYVLRKNQQIIASLTLGAKKPWAIDRKYFTKCNRPIYLTSMAVAPSLQHQGVGRSCLEAAVELVKRWPGDAIRLDAYDAGAGAGEFYRKCGFREVGRATYKNVPLIYFERMM